ncbi:peptidyl-tRNA hydrolase, PTH1 family [Desulfocicer vacuolatum DSM 3385]|uniref:Peptidyl-tRNA hydrolase n=1 Tax=Desulfocicer vacuolatum DSM 3385 TaxID=1121400 RepID=A0A1W1YL93_9BACT|nr:aminoacyl-tRNA hydrolase [Desulfocicer vacuolatum]SMC36508.1 peptidyl-tRNA hydrolase, PTH1 family [Desulfocicer vacuolatum DSM 3385]
MSQNSGIMVAGLGNPGREYVQTRHNIGFIILDALATRACLGFKNTRFQAQCAKGVFHQHRIVLLKPQSYMNRSGFPVQKLSSYYKIQLSDIIVVHDDLDLPFGRIRVAHNRGHGGHNGIRSIIDAFGSKGFNRVRVGVGRPHGESGAVGHVLGKFVPGEMKQLEEVVAAGVDACVAIIENGVTSAMNLINRG